MQNQYYVDTLTKTWYVILKYNLSIFALPRSKYILEENDFLFPCVIGSVLDISVIAVMKFS